MNVRRGCPGSVDVVVGAGQAGLAVSYYLRAFGIERVVLERSQVGKAGAACAGIRSRWSRRTG
jgi:cation diffusion facilitator CzcD-associated flavoprotein CzcO